MQSRLFTRGNFGNAAVGNLYQTGKHGIVIIHAFVNHGLDARFGNFQRFNQGRIFGDTDRGFCLHLGCPVGKGKGLISQQRANMHFNHPPLEDIIAKLL